jgi:hypothetical protein
LLYEVGQASTPAPHSPALLRRPNLTFIVGGLTMRRAAGYRSTLLL